MTAELVLQELEEAEAAVGEPVEEELVFKEQVVMALPMAVEVLGVITTQVYMVETMAEAEAGGVLVSQVVSEQSELFGLEHHAHSHRLVQPIFN
jgi:methanogenic corrinoid protein MtbC1